MGGKGETRERWFDAGAIAGKVFGMAQLGYCTAELVHMIWVRIR
jgi:hypothetical protein